MNNSSIHIDVVLDEQKMPEQINWYAPGSTADTPQQAKAMMVSFWDGADKTALRIDLWTKNMMVDEMTDFFYQSLRAMADTYERATRHTALSNDMRNFATAFINKSREGNGGEAK
jgi:gliding motility-associated protein GldC